MQKPEEFYNKEQAEVIDGIQAGIVMAINRRLAIGSPVHFGILPHYADNPTWKSFTGGKLNLQDEFGLKEAFIGLPVSATFLVVDEVEKDDKGKPKLAYLDAVPERVQDNKEFLEYHRRCVEKLLVSFRDKVRGKAQ